MHQLISPDKKCLAHKAQSAVASFVSQKGDEVAPIHHVLLIDILFVSHHRIEQFVLARSLVLCFALL